MWNLAIAEDGKNEFSSMKFERKININYYYSRINIAMAGINRLKRDVCSFFLQPQDLHSFNSRISTLTILELILDFNFHFILKIHFSHLLYFEACKSHGCDETEHTTCFIYTLLFKN